jgi:DNA-binding MarR family transcriptional regulator
VSRSEARLSSPSLFFEVYALGQSVRRLLAEAMRDSPLTPEEYAIYSAIFEDEQLTPTRMARRLGMPLTTAMDHVARLEARGHARRTVSPRDHRATLVSLTAEGLAAHRGANRSFERAYDAFLKELTLTETAATETLLAIREAVDEALARAAPREQTRSVRPRADVAPHPGRT